MEALEVTSKESKPLAAKPQLGCKPATPAFKLFQVVAALDTYNLSRCAVCTLSLRLCQPECFQFNFFKCVSLLCFALLSMPFIVFPSETHTLSSNNRQAIRVEACIHSALPHGRWQLFPFSGTCARLPHCSGGRCQPQALVPATPRLSLSQLKPATTAAWW